MKSAPLRPSCFVALFSAFVLSPLTAQHIVVVEHKKKNHVVRNVHRDRPQVEIDGKLVTASGNRFALHKVEDYLPVFVSVTDVRVRTTAIQLVDSGSKINNQFEFAGDFASAYPLEKVFVVLALEFEDGERSIFLHEVGRLQRNHPRSLRLYVPTPYPLGAGKYTLHIFSNGMETLHSLQPFNYREAMLDRMIAKRVRERPDGMPSPFLGPPPAFPPELQKSKTKGNATVRLRVRSTGAVLDPVVLEASDPAFGESAIEALRQWRFLPRIKNGRPVDAVVDMPLAFDPSED